ncbi:MAG: DUF2341 domain-containing protein [Spirochaetota bacterium]
MLKSYLKKSAFILTIALVIVAAGCSQYGAFDVMDSLAGVDGAPSGIWDHAVVNVRATTDHRRVTLSWDDPSSDILAHVHVAVSPGGQSFEVAAGQQQLDITPLSNGTTYTFTLYPVAKSGAVGASLQIDATPALPPLPEDDWVEPNSTMRRRLVIDNSGQESDLRNFQLLVELDASVIDYAATDGSDLRFFDEGTQTELSYEIERWDDSGTSLVWVLVPEITGASPQDYIWMYWGSGVPATSNDAAAVWAEYELVYHFDSLDTGVVVDSSPHGRHGVLKGNVGIETGFLGNGIRVGDASGESYVELSASDLASITATAPSAFTVEAYARGDEAPKLTSPSGPLMAQAFYNIGWDHNNASYLASFHYRDATYGWTPVSTPTLEGATWYYLAGTFDGSTGVASGFADGSVVSTRTGLGTEPGGPVSYLRIGTDGDDGNVFDGIVDEVRISHVSRSADWIAAQQLSMSGQMISFGEPEPKP